MTVGTPPHTDTQARARILSPLTGVNPLVCLVRYVYFDKKIFLYTTHTDVLMYRNMTLYQRMFYCIAYSFIKVLACLCMYVSAKVYL